MTDRPDSGASRDDSVEIAEVRRLLADARHTEPMPDGVAARMDAVLARLGDETSTGPKEAERTRGAVVPIAAHRRRRAAGLLVAAAAIVVGGVVVQNVHLSSSSDGSGSTAEGAPHANSLDSGNADNGKTSSPPTTSPGLRNSSKTFVVHPRRFSVDALRAQKRLDGIAALDAQQLGPACARDLPRQARVVPTEYKRAPAALVFRRPQGSSQVVDLFVCGVSRPVRTTTLPAP